MGWFALGARYAMGAPAVVMVASHIGFGAFAQANGISSAAAVFSTVAIWALPGQFVLVEAWVLGAGMFAIVPAVMFTAARFLPMSLTLIPLMRHPRHGKPAYFAAAHLISNISWAAVTPRCDEIPVSERLSFFLGFSTCCWSIAMVSVAAGYALAGAIPRSVQGALLLFVPLTYLLMLTGEVRHRAGRLALLFGALAGPLAHLLDPHWGMLAGALVAGTAAFGLDRWLRSHG
ncbi:MAG: AzlC family ABC transporter permease [Burkholderiales bacterium]|nr:AzlC family ABC transporter permease [Burkholderiales bacterium]